MDIRISMSADETCKAREAAISVLSKLAPYDADVAKALEGMLVDDYVGSLPEAIRSLVRGAAGIVEEDLQELAAVVRIP